MGKLYYIYPSLNLLVTGLQARIDSRPPVTKDISGPTPWSYDLRTLHTSRAAKIGPPSKYPRGDYLTAIFE